MVNRKHVQSHDIDGYVISIVEWNVDLMWQTVSHLCINSTEMVINPLARDGLQHNYLLSKIYPLPPSITNSWNKIFRSL